jgi:hypothetical protein
MSTHSNHSGLQEGARSWLNNPLLSLLLEQLKHLWIVWSLIAMQTLSSLSCLHFPLAKIANLGLHLPLQGLLPTLFLPTLFFTFFQKDCLQPLSSPHSVEIANLYSSPSAEI